jgi:hypothetical protein
MILFGNYIMYYLGQLLNSVDIIRNHICIIFAIFREGYNNNKKQNIKKLLQDT